MLRRCCVAHCQGSLSQTWGRQAVQKINHVITTNPFTCIVYMTGLRTAIFGVGSIVCGAAGVPAEFALAFAVTRPLKKLRLPLDIAAAMLLARGMPALKEIEMSRLVAPGCDNHPAVESFSKQMKKYPTLYWLWNKSQDLIDNYGAAYMLARDMVGIAIMIVTTALLSMDPFSFTSWVMTSTGITQSVAETFAAMAGGACISTMSGPLILTTMPEAVTFMSERYDLDGHLNKKLDDDKQQWKGK
eukprot:Rhum_TRINITY_DN18529_c0_g1::Rhum_TRINITY_DN18529_c0_g1_i1::g.167678::m.167678